MRQEVVLLMSKGNIRKTRASDRLPSPRVDKEIMRRITSHVKCD
jgi:hypothetical protein